LAEKLPRLAVLWADAAYTGRFRSWVRDERGWRVEVPRHPERQLWRYGLEEKPRSFQVLPRRWVVERTLGWLSKCRAILVRYEKKAANYLGLIKMASILVWYRLSLLR
jgi:putative transposase